MTIIKVLPKEVDWLKEGFVGEVFTARMDRWYQMMWLVRGDEGEDEGYVWLVNYSVGKNWRIWRDVTVDAGGLSQIDLLVYCNGILRVIEMKNYDQPFEYRDNQCYLGGRLLTTNVMYRMEERINRVRKLMEDAFGSSVVVRGVMVFIGEHSSVNIPLQAAFECITRNQFRDYIERIGREYNSRGPSTKTVEREIEAARVEPNIPFETFIGDDLIRMHRGVHCGECGSFDICMKYKKMECVECNCIETKRETLVRTACELGLLFYDDERVITKRNLVEFSGGQLSANYIKDNLSLYLPLYKKGGASFYQNPKLPFRKLKKEFGFE